MTDEQLNRLSMLTGLFEKCAKMGGTKGFEKIQPLVQEDLKKLLDEISPEEDAIPRSRPEPKVATEPKAVSSKIVNDVTEANTDRRV